MIQMLDSFKMSMFLNKNIAVLGIIVKNLNILSRLA
ncbi:hypothetical protein SAMN05216390_11360 [Lachnospiraceae bacterium KH1T2]|nr:hypothetical protein SAMN05216390_11360 [Lachnospiraceae bacterium KH1T2]